jgi:uncharacterized protein (TIGR02118 family)
MYKVVGLWGSLKPTDVESFEKHYLDVHVPLARKIPHLRKLVLTRAESGLEGTPPPYHRVAELHFDNPEAFHRATESVQWRVMREDGGKLAERFGVTIAAVIGWERE